MTRLPHDRSFVPTTGLTAFANQDYAGAFASGIVQEGFTITGKVEQEDAFGMPAWMHNAPFLAPELKYARAGAVDDWPAHDVDVMFGNPPCSGFSVLTAGSKWQERGLHGAEARQNHCMYDLIHHAVRCRAPVVAFESVQAAATTGRSLMFALQDTLVDRTRKPWHITLILMNAMSIGGWPDRRRFFFVASRIGPIDMPQPSGYAHPLSECIGDLVDIVDDNPMSPYSTIKTPKALRHKALAEFDWPQGMPSSAAYERALGLGYDGPAPDRSDRILNQFTSSRWRWDNPARVATGAILDTAVHPIRPRTFTHAEVGRIMGFPLEYDLHGIINMRGAGRALYGKGIPVQSGRWLAEGIRRHLLRTSLPTDIIPEQFDTTGTRWTMDVTEAWRKNKPPTGEQLEFAI